MSHPATTGGKVAEEDGASKDKASPPTSDVCVEAFVREMGSGSPQLVSASTSASQVVAAAVERVETGGRRLTCCSFQGGLAIRVGAVTWSSSNMLDDWMLSITWVVAVTRVVMYREEAWITEEYKASRPKTLREKLGVDWNDPDTLKDLTDEDWANPELYEEPETGPPGDRVHSVMPWEESQARIERVGPCSLAMWDTVCGRVISPRVVVDVHVFAAAVHKAFHDVLEWSRGLRAACSAAEEARPEHAHTRTATDAIRKFTPDPEYLSRELGRLLTEIKRSCAELSVPVPAELCKAPTSDTSQDGLTQTPLKKAPSHAAAKVDLDEK